ncbi:peroxiredoxin [Telmatobacter bradus]|uniref:peroxiredoxin n=1 Tax=Telmatobacter bradus TaxID=474953 RepID=UPI003B43790D
MKFFSRIVAACILLSAVALHAQTTPTLPAPGQLAPTFSLPSQDGKQISLADFHGKWVVLYFYPKDMTSGCTIEAHNFQRDLKLFEARNAVVLGVSVDSPESHQKFCTKESLSFRLLADTSHSVTQAYGSLGSFLGMTIAQRNTFLIDPQGKIAHAWTKVSPATASSDVLTTLASLQ